MSWADLFGSARPTLQTSASETSRFGITVDRLLVAAGAAVEDVEICSLSEASEADLVVLRYPAGRTGLFAALLRSGRDPLFADQLVYWSLDVGTGRTPPSVLGVGAAPLGVGAVVEDLVADLVGEIFTGYGNHYLADPALDPADALRGYQEWATGSTAAGGTVALYRDGAPVGLATTSCAEDVLEIELAGILSAHQGQGLYGHLLAGVEALARDLGVSRVVISTQTHNTGVQRAWARYGFEPAVTFATVHLLRRGLLRRR